MKILAPAAPGYQAGGLVDDNVPVATPALTPSSGWQPPQPGFGLGAGTAPQMLPPAAPSYSPQLAAQQTAAQYGGPQLQGTPTEAMSGPSWSPEAAAQQTAYQYGAYNPLAAAQQTAAQYGPQVRRAQLVRQPQQPVGQPPASGNYNPLSPNLSGLATNFGHDINGQPDQYMLSKLGAGSRIGAFGKDVTNPNLAGVSLPIKTINNYIGDYRHNRQVYKDIASGRYQVRVSAPNGNTQMFPIVDVGPGPKEPGAIDMTGSAYNQLGVKNEFNANFQIVDTSTGQIVQGYQKGGEVVPPSEAEAAALQTAGQYAGTANVLTPENASSHGLDPSQGFINPQFVASQASPPPAQPLPESGPPPGMAPGLGTPTGGPSLHSTPPPQQPQRAFTPSEGDKPVEQPQPDEPQKPPDQPQQPIRAFTPSEGDKPVEQPKTAEQPSEEQKPTRSFTPLPGDKPVEQPPAEPAQPQGQEPAKPDQTATEVPGQQPAQQKSPTPVDTLKAGERNSVDPVGLYRYLLGKFANSGLVGYVPPDGAKWGIKTGSAAEWAAFGLAVAKQESDLNARSYNASDPGGSVGLFQFGQGQTQFTKGGDQNDPQQSADAFVRCVQHYLAHKGSVANLGATFGSIRRPNEAGQYITGAQKVAAGGDGKDLVSSGGGGGGGGGVPPVLAGPWASVPIHEGGGGASPPSKPAPLGGGGGDGGGYGAPEVQSGGGGVINLAQLLAAGAAGAGIQQAFASSHGPEEEQDPLAAQVQAFVSRGFTPAQALNIAQSPIIPHQPLGQPPGPPAAPAGAPPQLQAPAAPGKISLPALKAPPPLVPQQGVDPTVVQGLIKRGFTRQQAEAFAGKATVSQPGAALAGSASFRAPPPPAPGAPAAKPAQAAAPQQAQQQPAVSAGPKPRLIPPYAGEAKPGQFDALEGVPLAQAVKQHADLLDPGDPRVTKQPDGMIKGEHFVEGDPVHDQLLEGLPGGKNGRQSQLLAHAEQAIQDKTPLHLSYISAPKEAEKFPTRESRRIQYDEHSPEARLMGTTEGQLVGHSMIPVSVGIRLPGKKGEPHESYIQGLSTNVIANNFEHLNEKLAAMGQKSPYASFGPKFAADLEGYMSNLIAGHTGTGRGYQVGTADHPNTPDPEHVPYPLTRKEADFLNTVINNTAAFAKHGDAAKLRELARVNGTLITPEGETNQMRHQIEEHEPGWRHRVLEPAIRTFKTGLIHDVHSSEEHMPATIRPGEGYKELTQAMARTSYRGRPDVPIAASLHHTFADNKAINGIERDFSEHRIDEAEARARLHAMGEDPEEYRFIGGSGGLITPYEDDPEALTPEEHTQMKDALKKKWVGGQMNVEDYRKRAAEVPLPQKPSASVFPKPEPETPPAPDVTPPKPPAPVKPPKPPPPTPMPEPDEDEPLPAAKAPKQPPPPAPGDALPAPKKAPVGSQEAKEKTYGEMSPAEKESYVSSRVKDRLANQIQGAVKLRPAMENGKFKRDDAGNPQWEKDQYDLVNSPMLGNKRLDRAKDQKFKDQEDIYGKDEHTHLTPVDRRRLSYLEQKSAVDTMSDKIVDAYHKHMVNEPSVMAAKGWYTTMQQKLKKAFGPDAEIFAQLLGATSARTGVHQNFIQSLDAYDQLKSGKFDNHIAKYNEAHEHLAKGEGALAKHMHDSGIVQHMLDNGTMPIDKKTGKPKEVNSDASAMAAWIAHHDILPRQKNGQKFNANSNQVLKVLAQKWLKNVKAPKTPNFAGNLSGRTREATIDVWAARFLHELGNEGNKKPWLLQPGGETGVRGLDFSFSQRAMRKAADKLGLEPDDLQAIAWYHQKHLWDQRGHTKGQGAKKASFDETFDRIFSPTGERLSDEEARKAFAGEPEEPETEEEEAA